jgi:AraC-like DNA-binding protein
MMYEYREAVVGGMFLMAAEESGFARHFFRERDRKLLAIVWNRGAAQQIVIDEVAHEFPANSFLSLNVSHSFRLERPEEVLAWQFNREFYCIIDHDQEVSCAGLLFYGWRGIEPILPDAVETRQFGLLAQVFREEFETQDNIQGEMLRVLLKRLVIKLTRLAKKQYLANAIAEPELDVVRQFSMLVENNYKRLHQVQDYARLLFKSPKTLSNLFARCGQKTPLQIISERVLLEGKRQLVYSDRSGAEIAFDLGFGEPAHFSRFFKKMTGQSPSDFKKQMKSAAQAA